MPEDRDPASWGNAIQGEIAKAGTLLDVVITGQISPQPAAHGVLLYRDELKAPALGTENTNAYHAEITVRGGNGSTKFECDWRGHFSVVCQSLEIRASAYVQRGNIEATIAEQGSYRHGAIVGFGGWHAGKPLTWTGGDLRFDSAGVPFGNLPVAPGARIKVPAFGRRFFPRFALAITSSEEGLPYPPIEISGWQLGLVRAGGDWQNAVSREICWLTPEMVRDGIDIHDAEYVLVRRTANIATFVDTIVTPVFELAI